MKKFAIQKLEVHFVVVNKIIQKQLVSASQLAQKERLVQKLNDCEESGTKAEEGYHVLMIIKLLKEVIDKFFFVILLVS